MGKPKKNVTAVDRFWERVTVGSENDCWPREAARISGGYTMIRVDGKRVLSHRFSFELHHRKLEAGEKVLHSCDNPPCVNPAHLRAGTQKDNMDDMNGRNRNGHSAKTHCPFGHAYDDLNTYVDPSGRRHCKPCRRARDKARGK